MKKRLRHPMLLVGLALLLLAGCASTKPIASGRTADPSLPLEEKLAGIGIAKTPVTRPVIWYNGNEWRDRVTELVKGAKRYVLLTSFLASNNDDLAGLYAALVEKAEEGVPVYFLSDGSGLFDMTESRKKLVPLMYLNDTPVHYLETKPLSVARLPSTFDLMLRYHQKVIIIDGRVMAIGGMNFNYISIGAPVGRDLQRDTMYEFSSPDAIEAFTGWFIPWWNGQSWDRIPADAFLADRTWKADEPQYDAWYVNEVPGTGTLPAAYGALISSAKESIEILPFLPALDENMMQALRQAIARGVKVSMVISYDKRTSDRYMYLPLLEMGVDMRIEPPSDKGLLHEKLMVVDDRYVMVGSGNFNYRSMALSYESCMIIDDPVTARTQHEHFDRLYDQAVYVSPEEAKQWRSFGKYLMHVFMKVGG